MKRNSNVILVALSAVLPATPLSAKDKHVYGPAPDWSRYKELGTPAVLAILPQATGWTVQWPNGYRQGGWPNKGQHWGYQTCGYAERSDPAGNYQHIDFSIVVENDAVQTVDLRAGKSNSIVTRVCAFLASSGRLPPASMMEANASTFVTRLGVEVRPVPEGAAVSLRAGSAPVVPELVAGAVITKANGIALAGLGQASAQVLNQPGALTLETAGGQVVQVPASTSR